MKKQFSVSLSALSGVAALLVIAFASLPRMAAAEPYLAVESGLKCGQCHVNPSGGGKRTPFGMLYARNMISANAVDLVEGHKPWTGDVSARWFAVGGDFRGGYESVDVPGSAKTDEWDVSKATVYAELRLVPNLLEVYVDQKIAPDDNENREAYLKLTPKNGKFVVKAGQMFLPFGLRLQDDNTFVRQATGVNFLTPDDGVELGLELAKWSAQFAVIQGEDGADDTLSGSAVYVLPKWRLGASVNTSEDAFGDRTMESVFGGLKTGPISWLAELSMIHDSAPAGDNDSYATLLEGNWRIRKGHNLKVGYEFLEPNEDRDEDQQERYSLVWEYNPIQFTQARIGVHRYNGIPNIPSSNRDELFAELHVYF
ncbi:MAG TPA: hypothetical protein VNP02_05995 [Gammaproteobacteria bacterium]|nr:hypothetical protein [Gammaproteobacteria bacterium]